MYGTATPRSKRLTPALLKVCCTAVHARPSLQLCLQLSTSTAEVITERVSAWCFRTASRFSVLQRRACSSLPPLTGAISGNLNMPMGLWSGTDYEVNFQLISVYAMCPSGPEYWIYCNKVVSLPIYLEALKLPNGKSSTFRIVSLTMSQSTTTTMIASELQTG